MNAFDGQLLGGESVLEKGKMLLKVIDEADARVVELLLQMLGEQLRLHLTVNQTLDQRADVAGHGLRLVTGEPQQVGEDVLAIRNDSEGEGVL